MKQRPITRRSFSALLAGGFLAGGVLEAAIAETSTGPLSEATAATLLEHIGYPPESPNEVIVLKPLLEQTLRDLRTIRSFTLPFDLAPAFTFHPDR